MNKITLYISSLSAVLLFTSSAHAYLDPVTGSIIFQAIAAAIGGIIVFARLNWIRLKSIFGSNKSTEKDGDSQDAAADKTDAA